MSTHTHISSQVPELEDVLFNKKFRVEAGDKLSALMEYNVVVESPKPIVPVKSFKGVGLHPHMETIIDLCGYDYPTPIQMYTIPSVTHGMDLIAIAQTGKSPFCSNVLHYIHPSPITYLSDLTLIMTDIFYRLWQDCRLPRTGHLSPLRQSQEVVCSTPGSYSIRPTDRCYSSPALGPDHVPHPRACDSNLRRMSPLLLSLDATSLRRLRRCPSSKSA